MKTLARAMVNAAAYLELADESRVDPELALEVLEEIAYTLSHCSPDEKRAVAEVLADMKTAELDNRPRPEMLEFLDTFLTSFGLADDEELPEPETPSRLNLL